MLIAEVDPGSPALSKRDARILKAPAQKRQLHAEQGRGREAPAVGAAMRSVWRAVTRPEKGVDLEVSDDDFT